MFRSLRDSKALYWDQPLERLDLLKHCEWTSGFVGWNVACLKSRVHSWSTIAFRIIASKVTGPVLQLAGLYQGLQGVQLSMERLSDIVDQAPEAKDT